MSKITVEQYGQSVATLVELAQRGSGGSSVVAQVLLSAYDGDEIQLNVADLGRLDGNYYNHAITVIRGRTETMLEPHSVIDGGQAIHRLWHDWKPLHLVERAKVSCPEECDGRGRVYLHQGSDDETMKPCPRCAGAKRLCACLVA